jgi:hypothetical protein
MTTYWKRSRYNGDQYPWELKYIEGCGYAAYATKVYEAGDLVIAELPTVWYNAHHPFTSNQMIEIKDKINNLNDDDKRAFYDMANVYENENDITKEAGIFMTNSFDMTDHPDGPACAMYCAIARLNHSCQPNVQQSHCPDTQEEVVYATRRIEIGEEINDCYIDLRASVNNRRNLLGQLYRFYCNCPACSNDNNDDDNLRIRAANYDDLIISTARRDPQTALDIALESVNLLNSSKCILWSTRYIPGACLSVYQLAMALNKRSIAHEYIQKAHFLNTLQQGYNTPDSKRTNELLRTLPSSPKKSGKRVVSLN